MIRRITASGRLFARCMREERGGEVVEYALAAGLLTVGAMVYMKTVGLRIRELWERLNAALGAF